MALKLSEAEVKIVASSRVLKKWRWWLISSGLCAIIVVFVLLVAFAETHPLLVWFSFVTFVPFFIFFVKFTIEERRHQKQLIKEWEEDQVLSKVQGRSFK